MVKVKTDKRGSTPDMINILCNYTFNIIMIS
jgi:hypothetical protein